MALLDPSILYARLVAALAEANVPVSYYSHVTGHGLLKLMRPPHALTYSTLNMGSGYAIYTAMGTGQQIVEIAQRLGHEALVAGHVEEGPRQVIVEPVGVAYATDELDLTPQTGE